MMGGARYVGWRTVGTVRTGADAMRPRVMPMRYVRGVTAAVRCVTARRVTARGVTVRRVTGAMCRVTGAVRRVTGAVPMSVDVRVRAMAVRASAEAEAERKDQRSDRDSHRRDVASIDVGSLRPHVVPEANSRPLAPAEPSWLSDGVGSVHWFATSAQARITAPSTAIAR